MTANARKAQEIPIRGMDHCTDGLGESGYLRVGHQIAGRAARSVKKTEDLLGVIGWRVENLADSASEPRSYVFG